MVEQLAWQHLWKLGHFFLAGWKSGPMAPGGLSLPPGLPTAMLRWPMPLCSAPVGLSSLLKDILVKAEAMAIGRAQATSYFLALCPLFLQVASQPSLGPMPSHEPLPAAVLSELSPSSPEPALSSAS